jgi:hypothetical protein
MEKKIKHTGYPKYLYYSINKKHYPPPFSSFLFPPPYLPPSLPPPFMGKSVGYKEAKSE